MSKISSPLRSKYATGWIACLRLFRSIDLGTAGTG